MTPPKKFINHVLHNVDPERYDIIVDMWGSNGWEVVTVIPNGDKWRVFFKREIQTKDNGNGNDPNQ